jgi:succinyl-CoA synthetase beta subunit
MAGMEIITVNPISKCLSRYFFASLTVLVECLMIFSAIVQGGHDVETVLRKPLAIVKLTVDCYRKENGL